MMRTFKRGIIEGETVTIIVVIISFVVLLVFIGYLFLDFNSTSAREICHISAVGRATAPDAVQQKVPLKCSPEKICITSKFFGGSCSQFAGEKNVRNVRISLSDSISARETIERESAQAMYDCWSTLGEGKLDLFAEPFDILGTFSLKKSSCVICSRLALGSDLTEDPNFKSAVLDKVDLNKYIATHVVPGSDLTYLQTFTDRQVQAYPSIDSEIANNPQYIKNKDEIDKYGAKGSVNQLAIIFTQIKAQSPRDSALKAFGGSLALAGGFAVSPAGKLIFNVPGAIITILGITAATGFSYDTAKQNQNIAGAYCGDFAASTAENPRAGCSIVTAMPWNATRINQLCGKIEGSL